MKQKKVVPVLVGWISLPDAAKRLSVKRQRLFQMGVEEDKLTSLRHILGEKERPALYVIAEAELCRLRREQLAGHIKAAESAIKAAERDDSDEGRAQLADLRAQLVSLRAQLDAVQLDAVQLLFAQLGQAADAADVAGDEALARLLRRRAESMRAPVAA